MTPKNDHIYRFVDTIAREMKSSYADKSKPSLNLVKKALQYLSAILGEKYKDFKMAAHEASKIDSVLNQLVKNGLLYKGKWRKFNRVGFQTVLVMADAWLFAGLTDGVLSWDTHLSKLLSIALISVFASRCGDVVRTMLYKGMETVTLADFDFTISWRRPGRELSDECLFALVKGYK
jgi:hypothetical protein